MTEDFQISRTSHNANALARWLKESDEPGILNRHFDPPLTGEERRIADLEGWILGIG